MLFDSEFVWLGGIEGAENFGTENGKLYGTDYGYERVHSTCCLSHVRSQM
jgi:hypothetical protein